MYSYISAQQTSASSRRLSCQQALQLRPELLNRRYPLAGRIDDLGLVLKDFATVLCSQHADRVAHFPARRSKHLEALRTRLQHGHYFATAHAQHVRKSFECVEVKSCYI